MGKKSFQEEMIQYYVDKGRSFPWRDTNNEFHAIVAEIMLQKTTAEQVEPVYQDFTKSYPEPGDVLGENIDFFGTLGLQKREGYVKNVAKLLLSDKPLTQQNLLEVKGIGRYTANAFLSIHRGEKLPIVDANVARVLRERFEIEDDKPPYANNEIWALAEELLPESNVREYNLGLLDYGASLD